MRVNITVWSQTVAKKSHSLGGQEPELEQRMILITFRSLKWVITGINYPVTARVALCALV